MRGESARPGKRPLRALSASEKIDAIQRVHEGESKASVARDIGVPESTLRGWCKSEHKIRGMARNSSGTPDSNEAHSPASSSGANALGMGASNLSSEDEAAAGPSTKKMRLDPLAGLSGLDNGDSDTSGRQSTTHIDYINIMNSLMTNGIRPEGSILLQQLQQLQQLNALSGVQSSPALSKSNIMNLSSSGLSSTQYGSTTVQPVNLVENGLQYTKSSGASSSHKHSPTSHKTAIAPTTQFDTIKAKKSPAEAPSTPLPASPRNHNGSVNLQQAHAASTSSSVAGSSRHNGASSSNSRRDNDNSTSSSYPKHCDEAFWLWLIQHRMHQISFTPTITYENLAWFYQWHKNSTFLVPGSRQSPEAQALAQAEPRSVSNSRAVLDQVVKYPNNNNDGEVKEEEEEGPTLSVEDAVTYGRAFVDWLENSRAPYVSRTKIIQLQYMLSCMENGYGRDHNTEKKPRK